MATSKVFTLTSGPVVAHVRDGAWDARGVCYGSVDRGAGPHTPCVAPDATQSSPSVFPQAPGLLDPLLGPALSQLPTSLNSFTVRVQGPVDAGPGSALPVVLFIHGGGFTTGGGEVRWYDAPELVQRGRFLLVTASYRLGAAAGLLGNGHRAPGGLAWQDLLAAARWVRDHIGAFGGDPRNVTVAGDSAGAWFAHALSTSSTTRGWFAKTLLISMPRLSPLSPADDAARRALLDEALASGGADTPDAVLAAQRRISAAYSGQGFAFAPAQDEALPDWLGMPDVSGAHLHTSDLLLVTTESEASAFLRHLSRDTFTREWLDGFVDERFVDAEQVHDALGGRTGYEAAVAVHTWWQFESVVHELATSATTQAGATVRVIRLDPPDQLAPAMVPHCFPLPFLFGERGSWYDAPMLARLEDELFVRIRRHVQDAVLSLVHDIDPVAPLWEPEAPRFLSVRNDATAHRARELKGRIL